ncbi:MAG: glucose-6-phosphate isomerase [Rickettsiales bacterium]|jgi:glucose-6-phosphate isomerase|nr:glucose-6-phosphate isomerase [Rickettsiales bacterium]
MNFTETQAYARLLRHRVFLSDATMRGLFEADPGRFSSMSASVADIIFDYSKNLLDKKAVGYLVKMAEQMELPGRIGDMFDGVKINRTEGRAALHVALRAPPGGRIMLGGRNIAEDISATYERSCRFAEDVRAGRFRGASGARILDVVNIGIGGSHLGPRFAVDALKDFRTPLIGFHFVSNVDGADVSDALEKLSPETTLFIVASKSFATDETMANAEACRRWLVGRLGERAVEGHFAAISADARAAAGFGVAKDMVFPFGGYVGGRYSMWGPVGLPILIAIGRDNFERFLKGARDVDAHFRTAPLASNVPVLMALVSVWNINFLDIAAEAVLPYSRRLRYLPAYLGQLVMESNGKSVDSDGRPVKWRTSPVVFGEEGTNGQHSFYQLLHQGSEKMLCDFIIPVKGGDDMRPHRTKLVANAVAQAEALMAGRTREEALAEMRELRLSAPDIERVLPYMVFGGSRPSNTFLMRSLTPETLGALVALYEHKTFVEGVLWDINPFDQFGVELGKKLAVRIAEDLENKGGAGYAHDSSTSGLIEIIKELRG